MQAQTPGEKAREKRISRTFDRPTCGAGRVDYRPDAQTEQHFGRFPVLHAPQAEALGFRHDGALDALLRKAVP